MRTRGALLGPVLAVLVLCGCSGEDGSGDPVADPSPATVAPDSAPPDPAPPDPAPPDPAPRAPEPDPAAVEAAAAEEAAEEASLTVSPVVAACADVVDALTDAVTRYEDVALAEAGGSGDRADAAADMRAAWQQAQEAATRGGGGLPTAAAPAMAAVTDLHDGLATRTTLDESDADPWRGAREALQDWCRVQP
ncbi:hypothetical protein [Geodermatophilus sabuli]|uniref:hypothetical protein n=1 Tax=Geodermatophilus sabuli TaxID=1564158 RepID=UPI000BE2A3CB|nr:hypothetical protein [Geodermatophilus sabuli]MBB3082256.1 hypothetical protein [Geodermatophilus sabuli]